MMIYFGLIAGKNQYVLKPTKQDISYNQIRR